MPSPSHPDPLAPAGYPRLLLACVLAAGLGARLVSLGPLLHTPPALDEGYYVSVARGIAAGAGHTRGRSDAVGPAAYRPPLYPATIAAALWLFGPSLPALRAFQIPLSLLVVAGVFHLAARRFGPRSALAAGLVCALSPALVRYSHFLWSENLVALWLVAFLLAVERHDRSGRDAPLLLAGVALGLAALTRELWVYFALPMGLWLLHRAGWSARQALPRAALVAAGLLAVVLPWTLRNQRALGAFVPIATHHWYPIAVGNLAPDGQTSRREIERAASALPRAQREAYWRAVALREIGRQPPLRWLGRKVVATTVGLYNLRSQSLRFVERGWLPARPGRARWLVASHVVGHGVTLAAGIAGLWLARGGSLQVLAALLVLHLHAVHTLATAGPRFLVAVLPCFALYAGPALAGELAWRGAPRWRRAGAVACLLAVLLVPLPRSVAFLAGVWPAGPGVAAPP